VIVNCYWCPLIFKYPMSHGTVCYLYSLHLEFYNINYTMSRTSKFAMRWWVPRCTRLTRFVAVFIANPLKQQSADRHGGTLEHIILIPSQPVFVVSVKCCVISGEATNTNLIVVGLTRSGLEPTIYHNRGEHANNYTTDAVVIVK
jgi:hypothetical protein